MLLEFVVDMQLNQNKGEEIADDSIWMLKSHDPLPIKQSLKIKADKVLCCVRNPFDTIASSFVFSLTQNQGVQIENKFSDVPKAWEEFVKNRIQLFG